MSETAPLCELVTIPISHFCEKARWALERAGVPYRERAHVQLVHRVAARRAGGGPTVPVLVCGDTVLADSTDILAWADARAAPERRLFPADPAERAAVLALEDELDEDLGPEGRRWMYHHISDRTDLVRRYAPTGVPAWQRLALPLGYPMVKRVLVRAFDVTPSTVARAEERVRASFDAIAARLADGRPYLMGDAFTAADLTFAALSAAVLMPPGYGVPLPQPDELPPAMASLVRELRAHPAGAHALRMYREERRA